MLLIYKWNIIIIPTRLVAQWSARVKLDIYTINIQYYIIDNETAFVFKYNFFAEMLQFCFAGRRNKISSLILGNILVQLIMTENLNHSLLINYKYETSASCVLKPII